MYTSQIGEIQCNPSHSAIHWALAVIIPGHALGESIGTGSSKLIAQSCHEPKRFETIHLHPNGKTFFSQRKVGREVNCWTSMRCFVMKKNPFYWSAIHNKQKTFLLVVDWLCKATHAAAFSTWLIWITQVWPKPISPGHHLIRVKETICHPLIFLA